MPENDKKEIIKRASFLKRKGYHIGKPDDYSVDFFNEKKNIRISMFYERYDEHCDVSIRFLKEHESYYASWFAFFANSKKKVDFYRKVDRIIYLLKFVEKNYKNLIDLEYCRLTQAEMSKQLKKEHPELYR